MLTHKQRELLIFISTYTNRTGVCPTYEEMARGVKLRAKSGIGRLIKGLEQRGFVRHLPHLSRAVEVLRLPVEKSNVVLFPKTADPARDYARRLACILWDKHWKDQSPDWLPCTDTLGLLQQIDNMTAGLIRAPRPTIEGR